MLQPYDYQQECLEAIQNARGKGRRSALVVMASGLGKTVTTAFDVQRWLKKNSQMRVLYLCHQNDILAQSRKAFQETLGDDSALYGYYHGQAKQRRAKYLFSSFQTIKERLFRFQPNDFDYIVVDEAHHVQANSFLPVIRYFKPKFILGLTATPDRMDKRDIREIFGQEVFTLSLEKALAKGLLTKVDYRLMADELVKIGRIRDPHTLSIQELNRRIFLPKRDEEIAGIIQAKIAGIENPRVMVFCPTIEYTERLQAFFPGALVVHSDLPPDYQSVRLRAFKLGTFNTVLAVDKFNEGIDVPPLNVIVFLRLTQSKRIFYQQLGRGLRKVEGKEKVTVLDFVGNCERVKLIYELATKVKRESDLGSREKRPKPFNPLEILPVKEFTVDGGRFEFSEQAVKIVELMNKARKGYNQEGLISQLKAEAERLGRVPTALDIKQSSKKGRTASLLTFVKHFGSWSNAVRAAGFKPGVRGTPKHSQEAYTREGIIKQLRAETKRLGRVPTTRDIPVASKEGRTVSLEVILKRFFAFNLALKAAGLSLSKYRSDSTIQPWMRQFKQTINQEVKRLGRIPTPDEIKQTAQRRGLKLKDANYYLKQYGSWEDALQVAELILAAEGRQFEFSQETLRIIRTINRAQDYAREEVIKQLRAEAKRLGHVPGQREIKTAYRKGRMASPQLIQKHFYTLNLALKAAGLHPRYPTHSTIERRLDELRQESSRLGRRPSLEEIRTAAQEGRIADLDYYFKRFGSLEQALQAAEW